MDSNILDSEIELFCNVSKYFYDKFAVINSRYAASGISLTEARIIRKLGDVDIATSRQICAELRLDAGYVSRILKSFVARELIYKRASETDKRQVDLVLTSRGRKLYDSFKLAEKDEAAKLLGIFNSYTRISLIEAMQFIERSLRNGGKIAY